MTATGTDDRVQRAFRLGWRFAQLYDNPQLASADGPNPPPPELPSHLPSLSGLTVENRTELFLQQTISDARLLLPAKNYPEGTDKISSLLTDMRSADHDSESRKRSILSAYRQVRIEVGAADARCGEAIDLGRMLADTVVQANKADSADGYGDQFESDRMQDAYYWLEDLHESFPRHASDAVKGSLQCWHQWINDHAGSGWDIPEVRARLSMQGERWRRILSGEIRADDLLGSDNYFRAISTYLGRTARQAGSFLLRYWWAVAFVLGGTIGISLLILHFVPAGAASVAAFIATAAGSLGVSWKTVGSTLGKVAALAEEPLWNAEVLEAITLATLIPPEQMTDRAKASLRRKSKPLMVLPAQAEKQELVALPAPAGESAPPVESAHPREAAQGEPASPAAPVPAASTP